MKMLSPSPITARTISAGTATRSAPHIPKEKRKTIDEIAATGRHSSKRRFVNTTKGTVKNERMMDPR